MGIIAELILYLPKIIVYLVVGFSFLKTYHFVALKQNSSDVQQTLTASLVIGFLYCGVARQIPFTVSYYADAISLALSAILVGYVCGRIATSAYINPILEYLKIRDTGNVYMWDDLMDKSYPFKMIIELDAKTYEGVCHNIESYSNSPHISLGSFVIRDSSGDIIEDYSTDNTRVVVLDTSRADRVDIIYDKDSMCSNDVQYLCDYNNGCNVVDEDSDENNS